MSKIKDALQKAKREGMISDPFAKTESKGFAVEGESQTRVVDYTEEAVRKHKILTPYFEDHNLSERFKLLRTKLISETQSKDERSLLITSTLDQEGKTFTAVNLAITFAREVDQTVLLVDVNLHNPSILKFFGIEEDVGLVDYLMHNRPLSELLVRPGIEKLVILPSGKPVKNSAELLRSLKMKELVKEMKNRYADRYVFFDAPSMSNSVDAMVLSEYVDKTLFVVESGRVQPQQLSESLNLLNTDKILGSILNKKN